MRWLTNIPRSQAAAAMDAIALTKAPVVYRDEPKDGSCNPAHVATMGSLWITEEVDLSNFWCEYRRKLYRWQA